MRPVSFVLPALFFAACSARPEDEAMTRQSVIGGVSDTAHTSVVSIATPLDATTSPELCTGTVIAPRVVLTAGHCTLGQDPSSLVVGVGPNAEYPASTLGVAAVATYPGFDGSEDAVNAGLDLGALVLSEDATVPSVPLYTGIGNALVGGSATLVGFGLSDASDEDTRGTRRAGTVAVGAACSALLSFGDAASNACHGDSGGPLLVKGSDGSESLAAVVSFGDDLHCATPSFGVRVDRYAAWIQAVVAGAGDAGTCGACPGAATDCEAIEVASTGVEAGAGDSDVEAGAVSAPPKTGSGCTAGGHGAGGGLGWLGLAMALVPILRRRPNG